LTTAVAALRPASDFFRFTTWLEEPKSSCAGRFSPDIVALVIVEENVQVLRAPNESMKEER
jgi:hypothetical protein